MTLGFPTDLVESTRLPWCGITISFIDQRVQICLIESTLTGRGPVRLLGGGYIGWRPRSCSLQFIPDRTSAFRIGQDVSFPEIVRLSCLYSREVPLDVHAIFLTQFIAGMNSTTDKVV